MTLKILSLSLCILMLAGSGTAQALEEDIPKFIKDGLDAYSKKDAEAAVAIWFKDSPVPEVQANSFTRFLRQVEDDFYGKYEGYYPLGVEKISPNAKIVYIQLNFTRGPAYMRLFCYKKGDRWILTENNNVNTTLEKVVPDRMLKELD